MAGYEDALQTKLMATQCVYCGRPLVQPDSIERGYGPDCMEKYWLPDFEAPEVDVEKAAEAMRVAPDALKERWEQVGGSIDDPRAAWRTSGLIRQQMVSIGLYHGAMAVSYGGSSAQTVKDGVDNSRLAILAVQNFAAASGFRRTAEKIRNNFTVGFKKPTAKQKEKGRWKTIVFRRMGPGVLAVHVPWNDQFRSAAQRAMNIFYKATYQTMRLKYSVTTATGVFEEIEEDVTLYLRYFAERDLGRVVNMLIAAFGDAFAVGPDDQLFLLPAMPISAAKPGPAPRTEKLTATNEISEPAPELRLLRVGDKIKLPDGGESIIQFISWKTNGIGVGKEKKGNYAWFSFADVETANNAKVIEKADADREAEAKRLGMQNAPKLPPVKPREIPTELYEYQREGVIFADRMKRCLIADEQGLGKTPQGVVTTDPPAVIVVPGQVKWSWLRAFLRWRPDLVPLVIEGEKTRKLMRLTESKRGMTTKEAPPEMADKANVFIVNYEILHAHVDWLLQRGIKTIIADEAQALKNMQIKWDKETKTHMVDARYSSRRALAFYALHRNVEKLVFLTGTPIMNRPAELFPMLHMINRRVWNSQYAYCVEFCAGRMVFKPWLGKEAFDCSGRSNVKELHERITPIMLRRLKTEVLDLPEKSRETIECGLSREYQKIYDEAAAKFLEWLFQKFGGGKAGEEAVGRAARAEAITRMNALRLICAKGKVETAVHYVKLSLEADKPLIVAYIHNEVLDLIDKEMKKLERDRLAQEKRGEIPDIAKPIRWDVFRGGLTPTQKQQMADRFQNGDIDVLFYNIALGTGTTLTRATEMLFLERSWVPGTNVQMEDRIHRISQKNAVTIQYLSAIGTIDEHIAALLVDKVKTSLGVIDGIECDENEAGDIVFGTMLEDIMARGRGMRKNPEDGLRVSWNQAMSYEEPEPDEPELPVDELPVDEDTGGDEEVAAFEVGQTYAVGDEEP